VVTVAALGFDVTTSDGERPAAALYPGPFVSVDGTRVAYRTWGSHGSPIVLVGGFLEASWVWDRLGPRLAAEHRVYALDLPPFGYTERRGPFTLASWVDLVHGFDRRLGIRRPVVMGHSLGAAVAVAYGRRFPAETSGVVLLDGDALAEGGARWTAKLLVDPFYTALYRILLRSDWVAGRILQEAYGGEAPDLHHATLEAWRRPLRVTGTKSAFHRLIGYGLQGLRPQDLRGLNVRALVVWGAKDTVDPVASGRASALALRAPFVLVPGAPHLSMLVAPAKSSGIVTIACSGLP